MRQSVRKRLSASLVVSNSRINYGRGSTPGKNAYIKVVRGPDKVSPEYRHNEAKMRGKAHGLLNSKQLQEQKVTKAFNKMKIKE